MGEAQGPHIPIFSRNGISLRRQEKPTCLDMKKERIEFLIFQSQSISSRKDFSMRQSNLLESPY